MKIKTIACVCMVLFAAAAAAADVGTRQRVEADIRFLADDLLEGRGTPGRGLDIAARYLAESLRAAGFEPGAGGRFLQPYRVGEYNPVESKYTVRLGGVALAADEYAFLGWGMRPDRTPLSAPLVYAGLGVVDVTQGIDPYGDRDLGGRAVDPPARSVMVVLLSGEERGLLGSAWYSVIPVVPYEDIVLNVNVDMVGRSTGSVQGIVAGAPDLCERARSIGEQNGIAVVPDQQPTWRLAYLTDNYHFDRFGVPAIHFFTGLHEDYHQPADEVEAIRYDELGQILESMYLLARHYADGAAPPAYRRPEWFLTPK